MHKMFAILDQCCEAGEVGYRNYLKAIDREVSINPDFAWDWWCFIAYFSQKKDLSLVSEVFLMTICDYYLSSYGYYVNVTERIIDNESIKLNHDNLLKQLKNLANSAHPSNLSALMALFVIQGETTIQIITRDELEHYAENIRTILTSELKEPRVFAIAHYIRASINYLQNNLPNIQVGGAHSAIITSSEAETRFKTAAEQGDPWCQFMMGSIYMQLRQSKDSEVAQQYNKIAFDWFKLAAAQGHHRAEENIAYHYLMNPDQEARGYSILSKLATKGNLGAQYRIGVFFEGKHIYSLAVKWFTKAVKQGHSVARQRLENKDKWLQGNKLQGLNKIADLEQVRNAIQSEENRTDEVLNFFSQQTHCINQSLYLDDPQGNSALFADLEDISLICGLLELRASTLHPSKKYNFLFGINFIPTEDDKVRALCILENYIEKMEQDDGTGLAHVRAAQGDFEYFRDPKRFAQLYQPNRLNFTPLLYALLINQEHFIQQAADYASNKNEFYEKLSSASALLALVFARMYDYSECATGFIDKTIDILKKLSSCKEQDLDRVYINLSKAYNNIAREQIEDLKDESAMLSFQSALSTIAKVKRNEEVDRKIEAIHLSLASVLRKLGERRSVVREAEQMYLNSAASYKVILKSKLDYSTIAKLYKSWKKLYLNKSIEFDLMDFGCAVFSGKESATGALFSVLSNHISTPMLERKFSKALLYLMEIINQNYQKENFPDTPFRTDLLENNEDVKTNFDQELTRLRKKVCHFDSLQESISSNPTFETALVAKVMSQEQEIKHLKEQLSQQAELLKRLQQQVTQLADSSRSANQNLPMASDSPLNAGSDQSKGKNNNQVEEQSSAKSNLP